MKLTPDDLHLSSREWDTSAKELVEDDGHAVYVDGNAESRTDFHQFRSWVLSCSNYTSVGLHRLDNLGGPEVRNLCNERLSEEEYVFWLQISVSNSVGMEMCKSVANAQANLDLLLQRQGFHFLS